MFIKTYWFLHIRNTFFCMRCHLSNKIISAVYHDSFMPIVLETEWGFL